VVEPLAVLAGGLAPQRRIEPAKASSMAFFENGNVLSGCG
jgi:hypothetical protein